MAGPGGEQSVRSFPWGNLPSGTTPQTIQQLTNPPPSAPPAPQPAPLPSNPTTNPPVGAYPGGGDPNGPINMGTLPGAVMPGPTVNPGGVLLPWNAGGPEGIDATAGGGAGGSAGSTPLTTPNEQVGNPSQPISLSWAQVENYWIQAGGNAQAASMAAAVADASSGLNAQATRTNPDGSSSVGLWLIPANGSPPGSTDPLANARAAVQLSQNGTDWSQWCVAWSDNNCGENQGTYLGSGSNALMSLQGQKPGASYNVFGSAPAGSGVGASSAAAGGGSSTSSSGSSKLPLLIAGLVIGVIVIFFLVNRKKQGKDTAPGAGQDVPVDNPSGTGDVFVPAHVRHRAGT